MSTNAATRSLSVAFTILGLAMGTASGAGDKPLDHPQTTRAARASALLPAAGSTESAGCSAEVALNGKRVWAASKGKADLEHPVAIDTATRFNAGSVAKPVTALAVLLLERDGRLSLDDPIVKYLPELPAVYAPVRIRHLLSHTSGVRDWQDLLLFMGSFRRDDELRTADVMNALRSQNGLNFTPGTRVQYSNSNYALLGAVVGAVSGQTLPLFIHQRIFEPLHMSHSIVIDDHVALVPHVATGYQRTDQGGWELTPRTWDLAGPGNLYTTADDLLKLLAASTRPGWRELLGRMQTAVSLEGGRPASDDAGHRPGLGFWMRQTGDRTLAGHSGVTHGTRAAAYREMKSGTSVAVLCNRNDVDAETIAMQLLDLFTAGGWAATLDTSPPPARPVPVPPDQTRFAGVYQQAETRLPYRFFAAAGGFFLGKAPGRKLEPLIDGTNAIAGGGDSRVSFDTVDGVGRMKLLNGGARDLELYAKISDDSTYTPAPAELAALAGCYASRELGVRVELRAGDGVSLELVDGRGRKKTFDAVLPHLWRGGFDILEFETGGGGTGTAFFRSTELAWRVRYERRACDALDAHTAK
jgi:CubicO group peptidase (beta-lactamase class C family)